MKQLLVGLALFVIFMLASTFSFNYQKVEKVELSMKHQIDNSLAGASLFWDTAEYAEGNIVFNDQEVTKMLKNQVVNKYDYEVYIFDDLNEVRVYNNKGLKSLKSFTYPYIYSDKHGGKVSVMDPSIILEASVDDEFYSQKNLKKTKKEIKRSTMYVVEGRKINE